MYKLPLQLPLLVTRTTSNDVAEVWDRVVQHYPYQTLWCNLFIYLTNYRNAQNYRVGVRRPNFC